MYISINFKVYKQIIWWQSLEIDLIIKLKKKNCGPDFDEAIIQIPENCYVLKNVGGIKRNWKELYFIIRKFISWKLFASLNKFDIGKTYRNCFH